MNDFMQLKDKMVLLASTYFEPPFLKHFPELFVEDEPVWRVLDRLERMLDEFFSRIPSPENYPQQLGYQERPLSGGSVEKIVFVKENLYADSDIAIPDWQLFVGKGAVLEASAMIKTPAYIGAGSEVRHGAYIRGNVITGERCTVGHATEVKSSIFLNHAEAGHFAYVGDSILGNYVNLGAGTKLANLPFRTLDDKKSEFFPEMNIRIEDKIHALGRSKLGVILGDGVETGCNSTLAPGAFIGKDSWIYPCLYIPRGFYRERLIFKSSETVTRKTKLLKK